MNVKAVRDRAWHYLSPELAVAGEEVEAEEEKLANTHCLKPNRNNR